YQNDSLGHATNVTWIDGATGVSRVTYSADYKGTNTYDGDLVLLEVDEQGVAMTNTYDSLKRLVSKKKLGVSAGGGFPAQSDITSTIAYDAYGRVLTNTTASGSLNYSASTLYDLAGRETSVTDTNGLTTTFVYDLGGRKTTKTRPDLSTEIRENYLDRRLKSVTGTGVVNEFHDWLFTRDRTTNALMF